MSSSQPGSNGADPTRLRLDDSLHCVGGRDPLSLLTGGSFEGWIGKDFSDFLDPADKDAVIEILLGALEARTGAFLQATFDLEGRRSRLDLAVQVLEPVDPDGARFALELRAPVVEEEPVARLRYNVLPPTSGTEAALVRRRELESLVAALTRRFLEAESFRLEATIEESLAAIARTVGALRVRLISFDPSNPGEPECFQYQRPGAQQDAPKITRRRLAKFPWGEKQLLERELIDIPNVSALPPEAALDRASLEEIGVASVLSVPAFYQGKITAVLTVQGDEVVEAFPEDEKRLLRVLTEIYTAALNRQRSERALRSSEERFRALTENMRDSICEIGEDGRILFASPSYADLLGSAVEDFIGSDPLASVDPEDRDVVSSFFSPGKNPNDPARQKGALVYRAYSLRGHALFLEATAREFQGHDGMPRVVVAIRDVTEREGARQALDHQIGLEARVAELSRFFVDIEIDAIGEGIESRLGVVGELAEADHSWMYSFPTSKDGFELFDWWREGVQTAHPVPPSGSVAHFPYSTGLITSGQLYHVPRVDVLPEEGAAEREDMLARGVRSILGIPIMSGGRFVGCLGFESFDREIDWSEETIVLLRMAGEIFYSTLRRRRASRDLHESQSQLLQSQKMEAVGTLAGGVAHDFNNHLAVMLANARFIRQELDGSDDVMEAIDDVERSADHCAELTRSLLAFSRRSPVEILPVRVEELIRGVEGLVRPLLPGRIDFSVALDADLGRFSVDRVQIQQVLVNLLVNARDSMPEGGPLRLRAMKRALAQGEDLAEGLREGQEYVVLSVEDAGSGMDDETRVRVFEPFFTTKELGRGTGLGLAMAYGIVRQSEGAIAVESAPGRGTTFRVYLPAHRESD